MIKIVKDIDEVIEFAWNLSQDETKASYHRIDYYDELLTRFQRGVDRDDYHLLACYQEELVGVCLYFWEDDQKYAQTIQLGISKNYDQVADEIFTFIKDQLPGYELLIPMPESNQASMTYFENNNVECIESSYVTWFDQLVEKEIDIESIIEITEDNFDDYTEFHDRFAIPNEMYFNSKNLRNAKKGFLIFAYLVDQQIVASSFAAPSKTVSEIYGLFVDDQHKYAAKPLLNHLVHQVHEKVETFDKFLYFVEEKDQEELDNALACGFVIKDLCRTFKMDL